MLDSIALRMEEEWVGWTHLVLEWSLLRNVLRGFPKRALMGCPRSDGMV